jgi:hypothetical protein
VTVEARKVEESHCQKRSQSNDWKDKHWREHGCQYGSEGGFRLVREWSPRCLPAIMALTTVTACTGSWYRNNWHRKQKWSVDFKRGNSTKHTHFRRITDVFHRCMRIFRVLNAYVVTVHLTTHMKRRLVSENPRSSSSCRKSTQKYKRRLWFWGFSACNSCSRYSFTLRCCAERAKYSTEASVIAGSRDVLTSEGSWQKTLAHALWPQPACSFRKAQAATLLEFHVPLKNCFVRRCFCVVHGSKPPLHHHNWLSFGKFQDTHRFLSPCPRHVSTWLPPSGETYKYATAPITQTNLDRFSTCWYAPLCCVCLGCWTAEFRIFWGT